LIKRKAHQTTAGTRVRRSGKAHAHGHLKDLQRGAPGLGRGVAGLSRSLQCLCEPPTLSVHHLPSLLQYLTKTSLRTYCTSIFEIRAIYRADLHIPRVRCLGLSKLCPIHAVSADGQQTGEPPLGCDSRGDPLCMTRSAQYARRAVSTDQNLQAAHMAKPLLT
jgi:hypothetical protein